MSIARPPANSPKKVITSSEGLNIDQWQSFNINKFVPEELQQILDAIQELLDTVIAVLELGIELAKLVAALVSNLFDLITAIVEAIRDEILALLDLFPKLEAGLYLLWIPNAFGGIDYYSNTFKSSLSDLRDLKRPPQDEDFPFRTMFFLWGAPFNITEDGVTLSPSTDSNIDEISDSFKRLFSIADTVEDNLIIPYPNDFNIEKSFFTKPKDKTDIVTNTVKLPENVQINGAVDSIRTTIQKVSRKSERPGVSHSITWKLPDDFGGFSRERTSYTRSFTPNKDGSESHFFTKQVIRIIGIDIVRAEALDVLERVKVSMKSEAHNAYSFKGPKKYKTLDEDFLEGTKILHRSLFSIPGSDFTIDFPPDPENISYYYAASFVYQMTFTQVHVTKEPNGSYTIARSLALNKENLDTLPAPEQGDLDEVDFANIAPEDIKYTNIDLDDANSAVGPNTGAVIVNNTLLVAPSGGAAPDWIAYRALEDLVPEIAKFLDIARNLVITIADGIIDDAEGLAAWILEGIAVVQDYLDKAKELAELLNSLLFPPMLGVHYMSINTQYGMPKILERFEKSLALGLKTEDGAYNPLLLDQGFQKEHPEEFNKRVDIPAYDKDHMVGGFIIAFQEPAVKAFLEGILGIGEGLADYTDNFQKIKNDTRLLLKKVQHPELKVSTPPTHPFVELEGTTITPDEYMNARSVYKAGTSLTDDVVNDSGDVEIKSSPGPYLNDGPPQVLSITCAQGDGLPETHSIVVPKGVVTAETIASLLPCKVDVVSDGSFVIQGKSVSVSPCSGGIAATLGMDPSAAVSAPDDSPDTDGEAFEYDPGDLLITFINNGKPSLDMKQSSVPIFQLNNFNETLLSPTAYLLKFSIEAEQNVIVDVTGNAGANPTNRSPLWNYTGTFPLLIEENINDQFTFQITGQPVVDEGIQTTPTSITLRALLYTDVHNLSAEILRQLGEVGYPLGIFSTTANETKDGATFFLVDGWAQTADVSLIITAGINDFLPSLDTSVITPGTTKIPYLINDVVANLNAAFTVNYFSNQDGKIRITGKEDGYWNIIKVHSAIQNPEYSAVTKALFGYNELPITDNEVSGIGVPMLSSEYHIDVQQDHMCTKTTGASTNNLLVDLETQQYIIEIQNTREQEYLIEFI